MKISKILFTSLMIPTSSMVLLPLVSCGSKQVEITPTINKGAHILDVEVSKIYLKQSFTVEFTSVDSGWRKIDKTNTKILVGGNAVNFDLISNTKLQVDGSVVTNEDIVINLVADKTVNTIWGGLDTAISPEDHLSILHVGQKIEVTTDESQPKGLNVWLLYGSYSKIESECDWREVSIGSGNKQYKLYKGSAMSGGTDITETFKNSGYTFTLDDLRKVSGKYKPSAKTFEMVYSETDEFGAIKICNSQINFVVAKELIASECSISAEKSQVEQGSRTWMSATVNEGALDEFVYTITADPNNTGSTIAYGEFKAGTANTGDVTITGTSVDKVNGVSITLTTTISVIAPQ